MSAGEEITGESLSRGGGDEVEIADGEIHDNLTDLGTFSVDKVLFNNSNRKLVCVQGKFAGSDGVGLVLLEKTAFEEDGLDGFFDGASTLKKLFRNDIYGNYECSPKPALNLLKTTVIHPATDKHIAKYTTHAPHLINETPEIYNKITLTHLNEEQLNLQWVYNILDHKDETERIVFEDSDPERGFILLPDLKWDGKTLETLYLLTIVRRRDIKTLRDLTGNHLDLLRNILDSGTKAICTKYSVQANQLRIYLHYHPSFNHLHVHFTYLQYDAPGIQAERSHLLANVISNIELVSDYYQKVTLPFVVRENDNLYRKFVTGGAITNDS